MRYALIDPKTVDHETQRAAHMALAAARKELRLPAVTIKWFYKVEARVNPYNPQAPVIFDVFGLGTFQHEDDILGLFKGAEPDTIYVKGGQTAEATADTVYHEVFHLWHSLQGCRLHDKSEDMAQGYANDSMARIKAAGGDETAYYEFLFGKDKDWASRANAAAMRRALGKPEPAREPEPDNRYAGGYDKYSGGPAKRVAVGSIRKQAFGRIEL